LTLGLGFIVLYPYFGVSAAKFYDDLKKKNTIDNMKTVATEIMIDEEAEEEKPDENPGNKDEAGVGNKKNPKTLYYLVPLIFFLHHPW